MKWYLSRQGASSCTNTTGFLLAVSDHVGLCGIATYYTCTLQSEKPTAARLGGATQPMEEQHTEKEVVAVNVFMGGLLCKAEGKYYSSRINIFNKKSASRRGFS